MVAVPLAGKTAIVTGAGSGINLAFARLLLDRECNVVLADIALRPEAEELVAKHARSSETSAKAVFQKTDVRNWAELEEMFNVADRVFGGADIVCPGAGVFEPSWSSFWYPPGTPPSTDSASGDHYAQLDINLTHPIRTTQLAIAHFLNPKELSHRAPVSPTNPRSIILISSVAGQSTPMLAPIYNATKHAINGFVRSLAPLETELGIRVTAVAPGVIKTPLWTDNPDKLRLVGEKDQWITAEFVAERMIDLVERDAIQVRSSSSASTGLSGRDAAEMKMVKVRGGFVLEVAEHVREVEQFYDPGPSSKNNQASQVGIGHNEIFDRLTGGDWGVNN